LFFFYRSGAGSTGDWGWRLLAGDLLVTARAITHQR
jgi:hypothetical protein